MSLKWVVETRRKDSKSDSDFSSCAATVGASGCVRSPRLRVAWPEWPTDAFYSVCSTAMMDCSDSNCESYSESADSEGYMRIMLGLTASSQGSAST